MDLMREIKDWTPIAISALTLAITVTPEQRKKIATQAKRVTTALVMIAVIGFSLGWVYDFLISEGTPSRLEIFLFSLSFLNAALYIWLLADFLKKESRASMRAERERLKEEAQSLREQVLAATIETNILRSLTQSINEKKPKDNPPDAS